ncbi:DNA polymerase IV [Pseudoduganella umbonata]|uniref:DNA polymerase IV n=1 Tax=Pseudoduganella umbonata TaxID=864828 RepID=A0A4P8HUD8_9BURK|nr:DNA polymerase IV [Pseudoduganella umbonata]MBB3222132.1 DNA polymerase-4 [Pseudoduganella umbonata]QCP12368.1 DNA polymerase IV [Pseudoduganella umbonata]
MVPPRRIAHLDMDAFFASVELLRYPELRGLPVVVGGGSRHQPVLQPDGTRRFSKLRDYAGRGVVTTSTYEARALGVFSAMGTMKAAALAPEAILLPTDFESYKRYSRLFKEAVAGIVPDIEDRGIDEIYLDLTGHPEETRALGMRLKAAVKDATGLTCSIGIAPNKLLAKISSDLDKPDGLTIITLEDVPKRIWPLSAKKINGIGPKAFAKLTSLGIETVGQLAGADPKLLQEHFGLNSAEWLHRVAHGHDEREVVTRSDPKGVSRETTFERDLHAKHDREALSEIFTRLCTKLSDDLHRKRFAGRTVGIKLRYADFRTVTRDVTLPSPTADAATIRRAAGECLRRVPLEQRLRLLGVRVSALVPLDEAERYRAGEQGELFPV